MQPARMAQIRRDPSERDSIRFPRAETRPPLRFGAALSCVVSRLEMGREVGLAKSGFRPTGSRVPIALSPLRPLAVSPHFPSSALPGSSTRSVVSTMSSAGQPSLMSP
jgi:hypothetical protein